MWRRWARSSFVPSFQVTITVRIASVSSAVNQPPCMNFAIEATKNRSMIVGNTTANTTAAARMRLCHRYTVTRIDVMTIVTVSARP